MQQSNVRWLESAACNDRHKWKNQMIVCSTYIISLIILTFLTFFPMRLIKYWTTSLAKAIYIYDWNSGSELLLKYQFWKKSLRKNETLSGWTLLQHICLHFWAWLLLYSAITPKSEDKYVVKVFNPPEFLFSEVTFFQNWYFRNQVWQHCL